MSAKKRRVRERNVLFLPICCPFAEVRFESFQNGRRDTQAVIVRIRKRWNRRKIEDVERVGDIKVARRSDKAEKVASGYDAALPQTNRAMTDKPMCAVKAILDPHYCRMPWHTTLSWRQQYINKFGNQYPQ